MSPKSKRGVMTNKIKPLKYIDLKVGESYWILQIGYFNDGHLHNLFLKESILKSKYSTTEFDIYGEGSTKKKLKVADFEQYITTINNDIYLQFVSRNDAFTNACGGDENGFFFKSRKNAINFLLEIENKNYNNLT